MMSKVYTISYGVGNQELMQLCTEIKSWITDPILVVKH